MSLDIHQEYGSINAGNVKIKVEWLVDGADKERKLLARPSTTIEVNILPATDENLTRLRKHLETKLEDARKLARKEQDLLASPNRPIVPDFSPEVIVSREAHEYLANCILGTKHRNLVPIALSLIEAGRPDSHPYRLLEFVHLFPEAADDLYPRLVKLLKESHEDSVAVFEYWRTADRAPKEAILEVKDGKPVLRDVPLCANWKSPRLAMPERQFADLTASENIWTNILTYTTFTDRCDKRWIEKVLNKVSALQKPLPAERFAALLRELDDDDFAVREKASNELRDAGARVRQQVEDAIRTARSAEVKQRLERLRNSINEPSPQCKRVVPYLGNLDTPEAKAILQRLADGNADPWLAKEAKAALQRHTKKTDAKR